MTHATRDATLALCVALAAGCANDGAQPPRDAGSANATVDGSAVDAGALDAGLGDASASDAGGLEASVRDGGQDASVAVQTLLDDPSLPLPSSLRDLGLYPDPSDRAHVDPRVLAYTPHFELWSNGSRKTRFVYLPANVDTSAREHWVYPVGTILFKSFAFGENQSERIVETRLIRRTAEKWQYATYQWNEAGSDATLLDGNGSVKVAVSDALGSVEHEIPSRLACRACHESASVPILGFTELQLNHVVSAPSSELERLSARLSGGLPSDPAQLSAADATTERVLGYLVGNCVHCHNGSGAGANSTYDLSPAVALSNLIDQPTESSASSSGIRVLAGEPDKSVLIKALEGTGDAKPMPPFGVQRLDLASIGLLRDWITSLPVTP